MSENKCDTGISQARAVRLRGMGVHVDVMNDQLKAQIAQLDDDELAVLATVKAKLNNGLNDTMKNAAGSVGGFVW